MKTKPSEAQQIDWIKLDLLRDADHAEKQAKTGPFFEKVTKEDLLAYAAQCRALAARRDWSSAQFIAGKV